jgi:hypothetical protein
MSLLRLLTAGKSLVGIKESAGRYRLTTPGLLPRFGAKKDPFRATTMPEQVQRAPGGPVEQAASLGTKTGEASAGRDSSEAVAEHGGWAGKCFSKVGAMLSRRGKSGERPAIPRFNKPLVQGELSLDSVRVVRNDLRDSDLEIVAAKPVQPSPPASVPAACAPRPDNAWNRVAGRLFGAGKV